MEKRWSVFMLLFSLIFILYGCAQKEDSIKLKENGKEGVEIENSNKTQEKKESVLVYGSGDYSNINPALYEHGEINSLIFSGLTAHNEKNEIVPELAESWNFDKKTNTYNFKLRKDVKWHDGQPFTAADVKFTIETINNPENGSEIASNYEEIKEINIFNDYEINLVLKNPNVAILEYLTVGVLPKHLLEGKDIITDEFNHKPVGTGPYSLESWDMGQNIILTKNTKFYGTVPKIDKVVFKIVEDTKARALQLKSGELDLAQITPQDLEQFNTNQDFQPYIMKTADYRGILYNFNNEFFKKNRELPNALSYAVDRQKIIDTVLNGYGQIAYSPLQAGPYLNEEMERYSYNPSKTKELLEAAGWVIGRNGFYEKDGQELKFTIYCSEGDQVRVDMANICAQQLKEAGANVQVEITSDIDWAGQEAYLIGWGSPFDPDDHTYKVFGTDKGSNFSGYSNAKVDELLTKARETEIEEERIQYYKEFQDELAKDLPFTFLAYVDAVYIAKDGINGITKDAILGHHGAGIFWNIEDWTMK